MIKKTSRKKPVFLLCIDNSGYRASLEARKVYRSMNDRSAQTKGFVRVIDESGEDYLYPSDRFVPIRLPNSAVLAMSVQS